MPPWSSASAHNLGCTLMFELPGRISICRQTRHPGREGHLCDETATARIPAVIIDAAMNDSPDPPDAGAMGDIHDILPVTQAAKGEAATIMADVVGPAAR